MKTQLRTTLDTALGIEKLQKVKLKVISKLLRENPALSDALSIHLSKVYDQTVKDLESIKELISATTEDMKILGETGEEKHIRHI